MMSVEKKIRELLEAKKAKAQALNEADAGKTNDGEAMNAHMQGDSKKADYAEIDPYTGSPKGQDSSLKKGGGETTQPMQGSSKKAEVDEVDAENANKTTPDTSMKKGNSEPQHMQGDSRKAAVKVAAGKGTGVTNSYETPTTSGQGEIPFKEEDELDGNVITEEDLVDTAEPRKIDMALEDLRKDIASVFAADTNLSEEFKTQASSIFEAAVIARVNNEVEKITSELAEQAATEIETIKEGLVEKIDTYLNYVVEQWMEENELAVDNGLRTEVAEDFMLGLKNLFQEHYFEVPEDKIDVLEDMTQKMDDAAAKLDEAIQVNIGLKSELDAIKRDRIVAEASRNLTATDAEKLGKLLEGVDFGDEKLFTEKVKVIKENYFPAGVMTSPEQTLEEAVQNGEKPAATQNPIMERYVQAIGRSVKK
jgi:hypothetical protein